MKVIAFYLPQFHPIPENDKWWGVGFTEWTNVKKAKPLFQNHYQPRIPLNDNYYNLLDDDIKIWQAETAKKYGIYGFCYYHYWFNGKLLLEKPMEQMLKNDKIDIPFCISWANEDWTNAWVSENSKKLISQRYGDCNDWENHFKYLLKFFLDKRYIYYEGKPIFVIYRPELISRLNEMLDLWQKLAKENGLKGIHFAYQNTGLDYSSNCDKSRFKFNIEYQPNYANIELALDKNKTIKSILLKAHNFLLKHGINLKVNNSIKIRDYDKVWKKIISFGPKTNNSVPGAFVDYDNTPRKKKRGTLFKGVKPEKFELYFDKLVKKSRNEYNNDMLFIFAWNEWGESGYLEPDKKNKYAYLEAIQRVLKKNREHPRQEN